MDYKKFADSLETWDPRKYFKTQMKLYNGLNMIISGNTRSGKTNLLSYLLVGEPKLIYHFDLIVVFSKTLINGHYSKLLKTKLLYDKYDPEVIKTISRKYDELSRTGKYFKTLFIFDDILDSRSKYQDEVNSLFMTGRHRGFSCIYLTQKMSMLSTAMRTNCMVFVLLFSGSRNEKDFLANGIIMDSIDENFTDKKTKDVERIAYITQTIICQDYNALIVLPYEKNKLLRYKAGLIH